MGGFPNPEQQIISAREPFQGHSSMPGRADLRAAATAESKVQSPRSKVRVQTLAPSLGLVRADVGQRRGARRGRALAGAHVCCPPTLVLYIGKLL
jgi:hypothetical protein